MARDAYSRLLELVEAINEGAVDAVGRFISHDFFAYSPGEGEPDASEVFGEILGDLKGAMPDLMLAVDDLRQDGEVVRGTLTVAGTKDGDLWGSPSTGRSFRWDVEIAVRSASDGIAVAFENVAVPDLVASLRRLDLVNPPDEMDKPIPYPVSIPEAILKALMNGGMADKPCAHLDGIVVTEPDTDVCAECVETGDIWPALRMCLTCGHVGCCDTSRNTHARAHYQETSHPLIRSIHLGEAWIWCYADNAMFTSATLDRHR